MIKKDVFIGKVWIRLQKNGLQIAYPKTIKGYYKHSLAFIRGKGDKINTRRKKTRFISFNLPFIWVRYVKVG